MRNVLAIALGGLILWIGSANPARAQSLNGSGSSFVGPIMTKWSREFENAKGVKINYGPVGSGSGIRQFLDKENDFGCTDVFLSDEQLAKARKVNGEVLHIPLVLGGVVPAYNVENVKEPLRLTGPVLADIYLGKITKWDDPVIKELNAGVNLPAMDIAILYRADRSGSTAIFTDYLAKVSKNWQRQIGSGPSVPFPIGTGFKGNEELAAEIQKTPGAIGYVELIHALQKRLPHARVKNKEGNFVQASLESVTAASASLTNVPDDLRFSLTNTQGRDVYPISGATWAVLYVNQPGDRGQRLRDFLTWVIHDGQDSVTDLYYARLPLELVSKADQKLKALQVGE
jgi:phosphate transport system substrate-binding protein